MMNKAQLAEIAARNQERPNEDVTALLAEVHELSSAISNFLISRDVLPKLWTVRRTLLYQKPTPSEYSILDEAISKLEGDLGCLALHLDVSDGGEQTVSKE
jgi:hypothetical protein